MAKKQPIPQLTEFLNLIFQFHSPTFFKVFKQFACAYF